MTVMYHDPVLIPVWAENLEEVDREIARMATICQVSILQPGVVRRVLQNDASVCGSPNSLGFRKLRDMLLLHFAIREKLADSFGQALTAGIEGYIVARLRKVFRDLQGNWPPE